LVPTQVEAQHFGDAKIVSAAAAYAHSAAVTQHGGLYNWGEGTREEEEDDEDDEDDEEEYEVPTGLGHGNGATKLAPKLVVPALLQGARVGRCYGLPPMHALGFAMSLTPSWAALRRLRRLLLTTAGTVCMCQCR